MFVIDGVEDEVVLCCGFLLIVVFEVGDVLYGISCCWRSCD